MSTGRLLLERRLPLLCPVAARVGATRHRLVLRDLSQGGVQLCATGSTEDQFPVGEVLQIACQLPRTSEPVRLTVRVVWVRAGVDHRGEDAILVGAAFEQVEARARALLDQFVLGFFETVVIVDPDRAAAAMAKAALEARYDVFVCENAESALRLFNEHEIAVLIASAQLPDADAKELLRQLASRYPGAHPVRMIVTEPQDAKILEELSRLHRVFYFLRRPVQSKELQDVVRGAIAQYWENERRDPDQGISSKSAAFTQKVLEATRRLSAQGDLGTAGRLAVDAVMDLIEADRAYHYVYDPISETLSSGDAARGEANRSAIAGVAGYVARTGGAVNLERAEADTRFERSIDDPEAAGGERLAVVPLVTADRRTLGVLIAVRNANRKAFSESEQARFLTLAGSFSPAFGQMALQTQIEEIFAREKRRTTHSLPFRQQALQHHVNNEFTLARPLQLSPRWVGHAYRLLVGTSLGALCFLVMGKMPEYAAGPAIVRIEGRTDLTATEAGIVRNVEVQPGQRVTKRQVLLRLNESAEARELERIGSEFELQLVKSLRSPGDAATREALSRLRSERDFAQSKLDAKLVRAPHDGVVNDVRIRPGQSLSAGDTMLSITGEHAEPTVVALIPGQYRPMLRVGQTVRLEMSGFRYAYADVPLASIADEVVGPQEARRYLGKEVADSIELSGPVVLVRARLPERAFMADGKLYNFHDGMQATAEVRVRRQRILVRLIPALQALPWFSSFWSEAFDE